jgi:hypothetical protein
MIKRLNMQLPKISPRAMLVSVVDGDRADARHQLRQGSYRRQKNQTDPGPAKPRFFGDHVAISGEVRPCDEDDRQA